MRSPSFALRIAACVLGCFPSAHGQCGVLEGLVASLAAPGPVDPPKAARAQPELLELAVDRVAVERDSKLDLETLRVRLELWSAALAGSPCAPLLRERSQWLARPDASERIRAARALCSAAAAASGANELEASRVLSLEAARACADAGLEALALEQQRNALARLSDDNRPQELESAAQQLLLCADLRARPLAAAWIAARRGQALHALGSDEEAYEVLEPLLELAAAQPEPELFLFAAHEAAWTAWSLARPREALELFAACERRARGCGRLGALSRALSRMAYVRYQLGDPAAAETLSDAATRCALQGEDYRRACESEAYRCTVLVAAGLRERAPASIELANDLLFLVSHSPEPADQTMVRTLRARILRAETELALGASSAPLDPELAARLEHALTGGFVIGDDFHLHQQRIANDLRLRAFEPARARAAELVRRSRDAKNAVYPARALTLQALCAAACGDLERALDGFEQAARIQESHDQQLVDVEVDGSFLQAREAARLSSLAIAAAAQAYFDGAGPRAARDALYFLDHGRGRTLSRFAGAGPAGEGGGAAPAFERSGVAELLRDTLREGELLLAFDLPSAIAIAATREEAMLHRLPRAEELRRRVDFALHALLDVSNAGEYAEHADALARALLGDALDRVRAARRLVVLADGLLHSLPVELLPLVDEGQAVASLAELPFLFRDHEVAYVPSLRILGARESERTTQSGGPRRAWILAHDGSESATPIPGAMQEARVLADLLSSRAEVTLRLGAAASESYLAGLGTTGGGILHVASHAWADRAAGARSGIHLAAGEGEDGRLTVRELLELRLDFDLVTLAGCEGAAGQELRAEGVLSVGWGFLHAGARAVLVSAAEVDDGAAARLFVPFYRAVLEGLDAPAALALARRELLAAGDPESLRALCQPFHVVRR